MYVLQDYWRLHIEAQGTETGTPAHMQHICPDTTHVLLVSLFTPYALLLLCRRLGSDSTVVLQGLPWSPRWPADEQVARVFNFLKQQAAKAAAAAAEGSGASRESHAAAGAGGAAVAHPLAGTSAMLTPPGFYI